MHSVSEAGQPQLFGDVTLSEGASIQLTQVGQDIEIAFTGAGIPGPLLPIVDCTHSIGEDVTPLRWNGAYLCNTLHIQNVADQDAIVIGRPVGHPLGGEEGGDILVYGNATSGIAFQLDADVFRMGVGTGVAADITVMIQSLATDRWGIYVDRATNPYSGVAVNYGAYIYTDVAADTTATGFPTNGLYSRVVNNRNLLNAIIGMNTYGIRGSADDFGDMSGVPSIGMARDVYGLHFTAGVDGTFDSTVNTSARTYGVHVRSANDPTVNKAAGTLTAESYGGHFTARINPTITAGLFVGTTYGIWVDADGTNNEGTQTVYGAFIDADAIGAPATATVYGVYSSAAGGSVNWSGYFIDSAVGIGVDGSLANATALQFGSATAEGGDIIVYENAAGAIAFQLDADTAEVGIGRGVVAGWQTAIQASATTTTRIVDVDGTTNDYTGTAVNYGINCGKDVSTGTTDTGFSTFTINLLARNYRDFEDALAAQTMFTVGVYGLGYDYGDWTETVSGGQPATRAVRGLMFDSLFLGEDTTNHNNIGICEGAYARAIATPVVNKAGPTGRLSFTSRAIYGYASLNPSGTTLASAQFYGYVYGGYFNAIGTTEGFTRVYGIYATATGGDYNYAGYFASGDVFVTNDTILSNTDVGAALANTVKVSAVDLSAGNTILSIRTEGAGILGIGTPAQDRTVAIKINGTVYYLLASTVAV